MALLHYENLTDHRPDVLMKLAFSGLKAFYDFLQNTKRYMESDVAIQRLAWLPSATPEDWDEKSPQEGYWVELTEPRDRPNEPESTFCAFLDENVSRLYELPTEDSDEDESLSRGKRHNFARDREIEVLDRDPKNERLLLSRHPEGDELLLRPNTYPLHCQIKALQTLQNRPGRAQRPLLRLFEATSHANWPSVPSHPVNNWMVLTDADRPGTHEQRKFVQIALNTPDFAFLEGPPGSGKTTAICELILQAVTQGKRVLLCASTHVAVDNVIERLMDGANKHRDLVIPVRIGDRRNVSDKAKPWQIENFIRTERKRLLDELDSLSHRSPAQKALREMLAPGKEIIERLVLDASNLVCGTTIGILQHPKIKRGGYSVGDEFDVLIVDEASKTTLQEFLVPALLAKTWVIVGDPKQLSPYVDDTALATNVEACLPSKDVRNACVDVYYAEHRSHKKRRTTITATSQDGINAYRQQAMARGVLFGSTEDLESMPYASLVADQLELLERFEDALPLDATNLRIPQDKLAAIHRRVAAFKRLCGRKREETLDWSSEISWRLARLYEQRFSEEPGMSSPNSTTERLRSQIDDLMPDESTGAEPDRVGRNIDNVRRVALPSILESLRYGFEKDQRQHNDTALTEGLPTHVLSARHVLLSTQHRMHSEIAEFSHKHIYGGSALHTPEYLDEHREWKYPRYAYREVWRESQGGYNGKENKNPKEARVILEELEAFDRWAKKNPGADGRPWEVAILTFYRGQEREVRSHLRKWTQNQGARRHFIRGGKSNPYLTVELCTVDRFQGHEADVVFISFTKPHPTSFLESPNRLNVALTRAKYQRVIVGDRKGMMRRNKVSILGRLADESEWEQGGFE